MRRLGIAVVVVAIWALITVFGGLAQSGQGSLSELVSQRFVIATPAAALFLWLVSRWQGWHDLGLNAARPPGSVVLLWPIGLYIIAFTALAFLNHHPALPALAFVAINTFFVGVSEELAFRGVLWGAARKALPFWPGVILVSALFGSVHLLNTFITGEFVGAAVQAFNAFLSGLAYLALRIRTRSLVPMMAAHWLWDLSVFLSAGDATGSAPTAPAQQLFGAALVAPITLYGLWLLRKAEFRVTTDALPPH
jgi:membrane protease YdiL (CAAX protease family)